MQLPQSVSQLSQHKVESVLTDIMDKTTQYDFVLQKPEKNSRYYLKCRIYFFNTPKYLDIEIG